jgi:hypothetical protein
MQADGTYVLREPAADAPALNAQEQLLEHYRHGQS